MSVISFDNSSCSTYGPQCGSTTVDTLFVPLSWLPAVLYAHLQPQIHHHQMPSWVLKTPETLNQKTILTFYFISLMLQKYVPFISPGQSKWSHKSMKVGLRSLGGHNSTPNEWSCCCLTCMKKILFANKFTIKKVMIQQYCVHHISAENVIKSFCCPVT